MLAYLSWHRPAPTVEQAAYEHALEQFHRSLARQPPCGFRGSTAFHVRALPWLGDGHAPEPGAPAPFAAEPLAPAPGDGDAPGGPVYEDWYLLEDWTAVGVLEEAAVSHGHASLHERVAAHAQSSTGAVYRLLEGHAPPRAARLAVWVTRPPGHERPSLDALLGDGMDPAGGSLWRRCLGLGPAPEFCMLARETPAGVAPARLPKGWSATTVELETLWQD